MNNITSLKYPEDPGVVFFPGLLSPLNLNKSRVIRGGKEPYPQYLELYPVFEIQNRKIQKKEMAYPAFKEFTVTQS